MPPLYPLEDIAFTPVPLIPYDSDKHPIIDSGPMYYALAYNDVHVDYFCKLAQGWYNFLSTRCKIFYSVNKSFGLMTL